MKRDPLNFWSEMAKVGKATMGKPKAIASPEILWELACEYFQDVDNNPWIKNELIKSGDLAGCIIPVEYQRPYTWQGLEVYLFFKGVITDLKDYRYNSLGKYQDYQSTISKIGKIMFRQKFDGASVGSFTASLISTELGLVARTAIETTVTTDEFDYSELSDSALEEIAAARQKAKDNEQ